MRAAQAARADRGPSLTDRDWEMLLARIDEGRCTPFLGAGAAASALPLGPGLARSWARMESYPLEDRWDLARVAQFLGVERKDAQWPKDQVCNVIKAASKLPNFTRPDSAHAVLARLPIPLVLTTNYDNFMVAAFEQQRKDPRYEVCKWTELSPTIATPLRDDPTLQPHVARPIVYHLHGHHEVRDSIVLTENDYFHFLLRVSQEPEIVPHQVKYALARTSLLFIGYRLADWDFRVLFKGVVDPVAKTGGMLGVTVQLPRSQAATQYLSTYYERMMNLKVYWGSADEFACELWARWEAWKANP